MTIDKKINSQPYWDMRFVTDWEKMSGPAQSREFSWLAVNQLPEWIFRALQRDALTLVDWGCAQGDGTDVWASQMPVANICGVDFSAPAIEQASKRYPAINFKCQNWLNPSQDTLDEYDIVFSSNTLEHFSNPYEVLRRITEHARKAIVLLLPYQELQRIDEHEFTFLAKNIPTKLANGFSLVWSKVSGPHKFWAGEQILLIYGKDQWIAEQKLTLNDVFIDKNNINSQSHELHRQHEEIAELTQRLKGLKDNSQSAQAEFEKRLADVINTRQGAEAELERRLTDAIHASKSAQAKVEILEKSIAEHSRQSEGNLKKIENHEIELNSAALVAEEMHQANAELQNILVSRNAEIEKLQKELQNFRTSASWRITRPLRATYSHISRLGTPVFLKLPPHIRRNILHKINPTIHPIDLQQVSLPTVTHPVLSEYPNQHHKGIYVADQALLDDDLVIIAGVPFDDIGGGQRSAQLARCALKTGRRVTYIHIYKKFDFEVNDYVDSNVSLYGLNHVHIDSISPDALLKKISSNATLLVELPHRAALEYLNKFSICGMRTVFELIDDWETSLGGDWFNRDVYCEIVKKSQIVVGTAKLLVHRLNNLGRDDALYLPNAANEYIFDKYKSYTRPDDLPRNGGIGLYFGSLYGEWFAWDFLEEAARKNPSINFVLIGDRPQRENLPKNIYLLGSKRIEDLPAYLAYSDFCLLPFSPGKISDAVSPIKVFEYLFAGKPVVSTDLPEINGYPGLMIEKNPEDFALACARVIHRDNSSIKEYGGDQFIWENSWFSRLDVITAKPEVTNFRNSVSVVILIHNNRKIIERTLASLLHHCSVYIKELIVVDNCSTDNGAEFVQENFPSARVIKNPVNGCASGRNLGIAAATGKYISFFDSDQWFTSSSCFEEALSILSRDANVGAVGWAAGWFDAGRTDFGGMITDYCPNRAMNAKAIREGYRSDIAYLGTGGFFTRTAVINSTQGFDTAYDPTCFEDTDISLQIKQLGLDICYRDLTGIRHQPHQTTNASASSDSYANLFKRNAEYFREKWKHRSDFFIDYTE
jgi:GT2 family glycosyltransferase/glycosyltransferase involved in cell wall biosynthesis